MATRPASGESSHSTRPTRLVRWGGLLVALGALAWLVSSLIGGPGRAPRVAGPQLVLLISIDTLRPDHLGTYGHVRDTSPVLDALAERGVVFEDASSTAPWTLPAHASMLTGFYPAQVNVRRSPDRLASFTPTLATQFKAAGYDTVGIATTLWFGIGNFSLGFDQWDVLGDEMADLLRGTQPRTVQTAEGLGEEITQMGLRSLDAHRDRPLFLFLHYFDVHSDYVSLPEFEAEFLPPDFRSRSRVDGSTVQLDEILDGKLVFDEREREELRTLYDAGIRQLDHRLEPLFDWVAAEVGWGDALVVVTSDHGEAFFEHTSQDAAVKHGNTQYQEQLRVPLIVAGRGVPAGVRVSTPVSIVDIAPTLLGAASLSPVKPLPGRDLATVWASAPREEDQRPLYAQSAPAVSGDSIRAVRRGRHKLISDSKRGTLELYDLDADPGEIQNLAATFPELTNELVALLRAYDEGHPQRQGEPTVEIDEATRAQLRALGYTDQE